MAARKDQEDIWRREEEAHDEHLTETLRLQHYRSLSTKKAFSDYHNMLFSLPKGAKVLEIGCGEGHNLVQCAKAGIDAVGLDISNKSIEKAKRRLAQAGYDSSAAVHANVEVADYPDNTFDAIYGSGVLHHLTDLEAMARNMHRMLKNGGFLLFLEPLGYNPGLKLYRKLTPGLRTADEHPLLLADIAAITAPFAKREIKTYLMFGLLANAVYMLTKSELLYRFFDRMLYPFDRLLLKAGPQRFLAHICVICAWKQE